MTVIFLEDADYVPRRRSLGKRKNPLRKSGERRGEDKPFIAWDGEGWTEHVCEDPQNCNNLKGACKHHYYLFGASTGEYISSEDLSTEECFDIMVSVARANPDSLHIAFSFKYDLDMIFRDISPGAMRALMKNNRLKWHGYFIECLPGKWLQVTKDGSTCRIYDLFSFFACSFVKALENWNVGTKVERDAVQSTKAERGNFTLEGLESDVIPYWKEELRLLVLLGDSLRDILYSAEIRPSRWHGPGSIADYLYAQNKTKLVLPEDTPTGVLDAGQFAYAGGRFEAFRIGYYDGPIYSADINSAYPYAMSGLPNMATGTWVHYDGLPVSGIMGYRVGMFHVRYEYSPEHKRAIIYDGMPAVAHYRYPVSGTVHFRHKNPGVWLHLPEMQNLLVQAAEGYFSEFEVIESWVYVDDGSYPFKWVEEIYLQRQEWKREGNAAEKAAKLGINSLYGKLAQRIGGKEGKPRWHNLEMAGHITSTCRAMLYKASWRQYRDIIAYQTDGIYSTRPIEFLPNGSGKGLGQWECETYSGMLHIQSGVYWLRNPEGVWLQPKTRGVPQQHMDFQRAYDSLVRGEKLVVTQNQFIRFGLANMRRNGLGMWRTWQRNEKEFSFGGDGLGSAGKRIHVPQSCKECAQGYGHHETLHTLMLSPKGYKKVDGVYRESAPHYLPWRKLGESNPEKETRDHLERWGEE